MKIGRDDRIEVLRPRTAGEIVDAAFAIFRQQPGKIVGTILPMLLVVESLALAGQLNALRGLRDAFRHGLFAFPVPMWVTAGESFISVIAWLFEFLIAIAAIAAASNAYLGRRIEVSSCYREIARRSGAAVALLVIWSCVVFGPLAISLAVVVVLSAGLGILVMLATGPWTIWAFATFRLAPVALIVEGASPIQSMKRSWQLTRHSWWRVFGVISMAEIITWIVNTGIQTVILLLTSSRPPSGPGFYAVAAAMLILPAITVRPFAAIVDVCLYFDLRVRREALDIDASCALAQAREYDLSPEIAEVTWKLPWSVVPTAVVSERP